MIKVMFSTQKNGEPEKEFQKGTQWVDKGAFVEIQDEEGKTIAAFQSVKVLCIEKQ